MSSLNQNYEPDIIQKKLIEFPPSFFPFHEERLNHQPRKDYKTNKKRRLIKPRNSQSRKINKINQMEEKRNSGNVPNKQTSRNIQKNN